LFVLFCFVCILRKQKAKRFWCWLRVEIARWLPTAAVRVLQESVVLSFIWLSEIGFILLHKQHCLFVLLFHRWWVSGLTDSSSLDHFNICIISLKHWLSWKSYWFILENYKLRERANQEKRLLQVTPDKSLDFHVSVDNTSSPSQTPLSFWTKIKLQKVRND
jgi:hypothetical protein